MKKNAVTKKIAEDFFFAGVKAERERIIKLLETECCGLDDCRCQMGVLWAIALIKGENK